MLAHNAELFLNQHYYSVLAPLRQVLVLFASQPLPIGQGLFVFTYRN